MKSKEERRRDVVVHFPESAGYRARSCEKEGARQARHAADVRFAPQRAACGQNYERVARQTERADFGGGKNAGVAAGWCEQQRAERIGRLARGMSGIVNQ